MWKETWSYLTLKEDLYIVAPQQETSSKQALVERRSPVSNSIRGHSARAPGSMGYRSQGCSPVLPLSSLWVVHIEEKLFPVLFVLFCRDWCVFDPELCLVSLS